MNFFLSVAYKTQISTWKIKLFLVFFKKQDLILKRLHVVMRLNVLKSPSLQSLSNLSSCDHGDDMACVAYE